MGDEIRHHGRRRSDGVSENGEHRRREDELATENEYLQELLEHGSRNFRRYRRRAYLAFVGLALANAFAIYLAVHNGKAANSNLAAVGAEAIIRGCNADNAIRGRLVLFVDDITRGEAGDRLLARARFYFPPRDCRLEARPLERASR